MLAPQAPSYIVKKVIQESREVRSFAFDCRAQPLIFDPGQFVVVKHEEFEEITGSLFFSTEPGRQEDLRLTARRDGGFEGAFYEKVTPGDIIYMSKPMGQFRLSQAGNRPVCFVGRNDSIVSARSLFFHLQSEAPARAGMLIHELTTPHQPLFEAGWTRMKGTPFRYTKILDQSPRPTGWFGHLGPLSPQILKVILPDYVQYHYFVAGNPEAGSRLALVLKDGGVAPSQITLESPVSGILPA
ncbi:MAG: hypothetical protein SFY92_05185 [Verrucomicrobiae bacterium]|nr:hypothetical protein [Verrucomicrobiae bacterium]